MVNRPLALDQYIGGESQSDGFQFNWLVPLPQYLSLTGGAGDHFGADYPRNEVGDFRHLNALNYWGRLSSYFDLTQDWEVELGVSGLLNPATDPGIASMQDGDSLMETERRLAGADFSLKWAPLRNNQFQSLTWGNEVLLSDNRYTGSIPTVSSIPVDTTIESWGLYSYLTWKFTREWSAGFLFNWVENAMDSKDRTAEYSPCITWAMSHWNQVRLEYTYTRHNDISGLPDNHAVYLQWAWIIGAHAHGWQQR
jgi:hypothetical protein